MFCRGSLVNASVVHFFPSGVLRRQNSCPPFLTRTCEDVTSLYSRFPDRIRSNILEPCVHVGSSKLMRIIPPKRISLCRVGTERTRILTLPGELDAIYSAMAQFRYCGARLWTSLVV